MVVVFEVTEELRGRIQVNPTGEHAVHFPEPSPDWSGVMVRLNGTYNSPAWRPEDYPVTSALLDTVMNAEVVIAPVVRNPRHSVVESVNGAMEFVFRDREGRNNVDPPILDSAVVGIIGARWA